MNRRGFIGSILTATTALALDPERLLWVPGKKTIFLPQLIKPGFVGLTYNSIRMYDDAFSPGMPVFTDQIKDVVQTYILNGSVYQVVVLKDSINRPTTVRLGTGVGR